MQAKTVYILSSFCSSVLFTIALTVVMVYQVNVVKLDPLQLVLVGTTLEVTAFLFEVPTGVVADLKSRRLSVILGYLLNGLGLMMMGWIPLFWAVVASNVIRGIGGTFMSGAYEAWLVDETIAQHGNDNSVGMVFMRASQASSVGSIIGILLGVALGWQDVSVPILIGGGGLLVVSVALCFTMRERGFKPVPVEQRETWVSMRATISTAILQIRSEHYLLLILAISFLYGLSSEGYDRLTAPHLLHDYELPFKETVVPVAWFGLISLVSSIISLVMTEAAKRGINLRSGTSVSAALMFSNAGIVAAILCLAWTNHFWGALAAIWVIRGLRHTGGPLLVTWYNQQIKDSSVRATVLSVRAQADSIGQIAGGPPAGVIGRWLSVRWGITTSAAMLSPVIPIYGYAAVRISKETPEDSESVPAETDTEK